MNKIIKIDRLNHSGEGIGKLDNITIFIPKTIKDDIVEINDIQDFKNYKRATVSKYLKRGSDFVESNCQYYYQCGGCHISNLSYDKQLSYKKDKINDIFKKYLNIKTNIDIIPSDNIYQYRNKITLHINNGKIGLYENKTNSIVEIDKCLLVSNRLNKIINKLKKIDLSKVKSIVLKESLNEVMLIISGTIPKEYLNNLKEVTTIIYNNKTIKGTGYITQTIKDLKFIVSPESFFQINNNQVVKLYDKILEYSKINKNDTVIDLYCGTGTIGIYLARYCKEVIGIEIVPSAIKDANKNKEINKINNITFIEGDVGKLINKNYKASIVIVDPPRSGLDKRTRKVLLEILPQRIIYVSCNPITMVRDLQELLKTYNIENNILLDMFPGTYHVESVCALNKR